MAVSMALTSMSLCNLGKATVQDVSTKLMAVAPKCVLLPFINVINSQANTIMGNKSKAKWVSFLLDNLGSSAIASDMLCGRQTITALTATKPKINQYILVFLVVVIDNYYHLGFCISQFINGIILLYLYINDCVMSL